MDRFLKVLVVCLTGAMSSLAGSGVISPELAGAGGVLLGALAGLFHTKPGK